MKKFWKNNKTWLIPVAAILACALCLGIGMGAFDGFGDDLKEKTVNEANILKYEDYKDISGEYSGVDVKVLKDGSIKLDGTATQRVQILLTEDIAEGIMTFAALDMGDEAKNSYIMVECIDDNDNNWSVGKTLASNYVTFTASGGFCVKHDVILVIESGDTFDEVTIRPVLTNGVVPQTFYSIT